MPSQNNPNPVTDVDPSENTIGGGAQALSAADADPSEEETSAQEASEASGEGAIIAE